MPARFSRLSPIALAALLAFALPLAARAQKVPTPPPLGSSADTSLNGTDSPFANNPPDPAHSHMLRAMSRERNAARQEEIVEDTQQLLGLAKQLQAAVAKSNKNELSLEVVNTAAEIEKLAKSVKEKMRDGQ